MAGNTDGPGKRPERGPDTGGSSKRPYATIEVKATEIKSDPPATKPAGASSATSTSAGSPVSGAQRETAEKVSTAAARATDPKASASDTKSATAGGTRPAGREGAAATPPPARSGSGFGRVVSHLAAGIVGGAIVLLGAPYVPGVQGLLGQQAGPPPISPEAARRLAALEDAVKQRSAGVPQDVAKRLTALEGSVQKLSAMPETVGGLGRAYEQLAQQVKDVKASVAKEAPISGDAAMRIAKLEERLSALSAAAMSEGDRAGRIPQLAQITGKLADLETAMTNRLAALRKDTTQEIESRLSAVASASEAARSGTQRIDREVTGLKSDTTRLATRLDQVRTSADRIDETVKGLGQTTATLKSEIEATRSDLDARFKQVARPSDISAALAPVTARIGALESSVKSVVTAESDRRANAERIVLSIELGNLKRAMDRGSAYAGELAQVKKLAGNRLDLSALERYQGEGVATPAELAREFRPLANRIIDAADDTGDSSVVDRLLSGARSIVRIRKTSVDPGDTSIEATVARIENALKDGRLAEVIKLATSLPPRAQAPVKDWLRKVEARQSVQAALASIDDQLKASLAGTPSGPKGGKP